ncbi:hypothetical protein WJX73_007511 [Symbiochloris irregularis]|uniref:Alpha/beta hydrolase fold-3 domain-containing protein n=1 Tax=Symbiochloris irregularis TaxID=706552 RepID=A0AAW1PEL1_9CHLO
MSGAHLLLPEGQRYYDSLREQPRFDPSITPAEWRKGRLSQMPKLVLPEHVREPVDATVPAEETGTEVPLRIYAPKGDNPAVPVLVYFHGGGFVGGNLNSHAQIAANYCEYAQAVVIAVDYPLAPKHPFPAAVEASWSALRWAAANAERYGGDPERLAVVGESAGGNLTLVMGLLAKQREQPHLIQALVSLCPVVDAADMTRQSYKDFCDDEFEPKAQIEATSEDCHPPSSSLQRWTY